MPNSTETVAAWDFIARSRSSETSELRLLFNLSARPRFQAAALGPA